MKHSTGAARRGEVTGVISLCLKVVSTSVPCHWLEKGAKPRSEFFNNQVTCGLRQNDLCHKQNSMGIFKRKWKWTFNALKDVQWYKLLSQLKANMCQDHTVTRSSRESTKGHYLHLQTDFGNCQEEWVIFMTRAINFLEIN